MINVDKICEEIIWYSEKDKDTGMWIIPIVTDYDFTITKESSWLNGTFVENDHCFETMKKWEKEFGVKFILETMRGPSNIQPAIDFCKENGIEFFGIGRNPLQDKDGDITCKCWGIFDIDDRNLGTFLIYPENGRPYIDWVTMEKFGTSFLRQICERLPQMEEEVLKRKAEVENKSHIN